MRVGVLVEQVLAPVPGGTGRYARELAARARGDGAGRGQRDRLDGLAPGHRPGP